MGEITGIGWTDHTFNAWIGCKEISAACDFCYARELDKRYQWGIPADQRIVGAAPHWGDGAPRYRTSATTWRNPITWNRKAQEAGRPARVFCNSLSDVFDNEVPDEWRDDLFALWRATPWLRWQVVTKRTPNIRKMLPKDWGDGYPNVGLIATTADQAEFDRDAPRLLAVPARWHGFSIEPQLGAISPLAIAAAHRGSIWLITGGESAQPNAKRSDGEPIPKAPRHYDPEWARILIRTAELQRNASVYVKQTGAHPIGMPAPRDGMGKDPMAWPENIRVQQFPPELIR